MLIGGTLKCKHLINCSCRNYFSLNMSRSDIKTFVFLDLETTGLPHLENYKTRITELCMTVVKSEHLRLGVFPRVQNKLSLCFNPRKCIMPDVTKMTGLTNELLESHSPFHNKTVQALNNFLQLQETPLCFVAHNGNFFDYPILRYELDKTGEALTNDVLCIDSLKAFRELHASFLEETCDESNSKPTQKSEPTVPFELIDEYDEILCKIAEDVENNMNMKQIKNNLSPDEWKKVIHIQQINETTPKKQMITNSSNFTDEVDLAVNCSFSNKGGTRKIHIASSKKQLNFKGMSFKLKDVFSRLTGKPPLGEHRAECDVNMLIESAAALGEKFVNWANINAVRFYDIPIMTPGRKLGT